MAAQKPKISPDKKEVMAGKPKKKILLFQVITEVILILAAIGVIAWAIFMAVDYKIRRERDLERADNIKEVQVAIKNYYQKYGHYPQTPTRDWGFLAQNPEMKEFFDFEKFRDPCRPEVIIPTNGQIICQGKTVTYEYAGVNCQGDGCGGYSLKIWLETGGKQEFVPQDISDVY